MLGLISESSVYWSSLTFFCFYWIDISRNNISQCRKKKTWQNSSVLFVAVVCWMPVAQRKVKYSIRFNRKVLHTLFHPEIPIYPIPSHPLIAYSATITSAIKSDPNFGTNKAVNKVSGADSKPSLAICKEQVGKIKRRWNSVSYLLLRLCSCQYSKTVKTFPVCSFSSLSSSDIDEHNHLDKSNSKWSHIAPVWQRRHLWLMNDNETATSTKQQSNDTDANDTDANDTNTNDISTNYKQQTQLTEDPTNMSDERWWDLIEWQAPTIIKWPYRIFVIFSPQRQFLVKFFSTQKCVNRDKTDFRTKVRESWQNQFYNKTA